MTTDAPVDDAPVEPTTPTPPPRTSWVASLVAITGVIVIAVLVLQAVGFALSAAGGTRNAIYAADVDGVTALDVDLTSGDLTITFDAVPEATLEVTSTGWRNRVDWTLEVDGGRLVVHEDDDLWFWPDFGRSHTSAELVLPAALEGAISGDLDVSAGTMEVDGDLAEVTIDVSAGSLTFVGASTSIDAKVSAGEATVITSDPDTVAVRVSAGRFHGTVTGEPPARTDVNVSAGDATLRLPDAAYAVTGEVSAGDRTIDVRTDPGSEYQLHVQVSAGDATVGYSA